MMAYVGVMQRNDVLSGITIFAVLHSHAPPPSRCPEFFTSATPFQGKCPMHHSCILQVWPCEAVPSVPGSPTRSHVLQPSSQHFFTVCHYFEASVSTEDDKSLGAKEVVQWWMSNLATC